MTQAKNVAKGGSNFDSSGQLDLTTGVTGTLPAANGGTGTTTFPAPGTSGNLLTSNGSAWTSAAPAPGVLTGSLLMWAAGTAPTGYLFCDGTAVSRTTYAALFAVISTAFGVGDGSTTFNLPNYTNRVPYGATLATTGGSADAIVVSHTHTASVTDSGHTHGYLAPTYFTAGQGGGGTSSAALFSNPPPTYQTNSATTGISVTNASTGSSGTNANLPPYLGINFIIKTQ